jgi:O-antigen/teichoic acid export membrane protein
MSAADVLALTFLHSTCKGGSVDELKQAKHGVAGRAGDHPNCRAAVRPDGDAAMKRQLPGFWKNVATVLSGALGAQALPLLAAPLITRLCAPAEMGAFSVWLGVITVASIGATLRMETAMLLDHGLEQQRTCFGVVAYAATVLALVMTLCAAAARFWELPMARNMSWFGVLTIGIGTWLSAYIQTMLAYAISHQQFGKAAKAKVWSAAGIALAQLGLLFAGLGGMALLAGQLLGLGAGLLAARALLAPPPARLALTLDAAQLRYLRKHQNFWRYSLPSCLLNAMAAQLPLFLIGIKHGVLAAGLFALTQRVLGAPISLLAASVLDVFKRQSVHEYQTIGNCRRAYRYTFKALLLLGLGPSLVLFLYSPQLFSWVFGPAWRPAGELARILAPLYFLNFIASPLSYVFLVVGKQKIELIWQVALFLMTLAVFMAPASLDQSVLWYTIGYSLLYLVYLRMSYQCSLNRLATA